MQFIKVEFDNKEAIRSVHHIIMACAINLAKRGLFHWLIPYTIYQIKQDSKIGRTYLVNDEGSNVYTSTFNIKELDNNTILISKIATLPTFEGKGIGSLNLRFIENYAVSQKKSIIKLEVYKKSKHVIKFYTKNGFKIMGDAPSILFKKYEMIKEIKIQDNE